MSVLVHFPATNLRRGLNNYTYLLKALTRNP